MPTTLAEWVASGDLAVNAERNGWSVRYVPQNASLFVVTMKAKDEQPYHVLAQWSNYPDVPSLLFCTQDLDTTVRQAWPMGDGEFHGYVKVPPDRFICCPYTLEGFQHHPDWRSIDGPRWKAGESTLVDSLLFIQNYLLLGKHYTGRHIP